MNAIAIDSTVPGGQLVPEVLIGSVALAKVFDHGYKTARYGLSRDLNPYAPGTQAFGVWLDGWDRYHAEREPVAPRQPWANPVVAKLERRPFVVMEMARFAGRDKLLSLADRLATTARRWDAKDVAGAAERSLQARLDEREARDLALLIHPEVLRRLSPAELIGRAA